VLVGAAALFLGLALATGAHTYASAVHGKANATKKVQAIDSNGSFAFSPKTVTVKVGTKVTWSNPSQAPHTVTSKTSSWKFNKQLPQGGSVSAVFKKAGRYTYYCAIHPFMKAVVVVKP
jgi:plastocyanin